MDQTDSSETFREIKSLLKITTNHSEIDKNELLTDILPKVLSLDLNHKTLIVLELLDRLDTESNMAWFIPALNKILTKICFIQQNSRIFFNKYIFL
ncbi:hypothetical protein HZS_3487 [Henneguya salminicola]|nr:hypothetical protein HZS_3487 [Henneguya salminicola]